MKFQFQPQDLRYITRLIFIRCCLSSDNVKRLSHAMFSVPWGAIRLLRTGCREITEIAEGLGR